MRKIFYLLTFVWVFYSCNPPNSKQEARSDSSKVAMNDPETNKEIGDSIFKIGEFMFEAKKNATFEFIKKGEQPKLKTQGDTLYKDADIIMLGDQFEITSFFVYKKFDFKSKWADYKVENIYNGVLARPNFKTDPSAKSFITRIKNSCKNDGINFAGHYTIVEWGCGALCQQMAIVDRITGKIMYSDIPFDKNEGYSGSSYHIDSRRLVINIEALSEFKDYEPGYKRSDCWRIPAVYELKNGKLEKIE